MFEQIIPHALGYRGNLGDRAALADDEFRGGTWFYGRGVDKGNGVAFAVADTFDYHWWNIGGIGIQIK